MTHKLYINAYFIVSLHLISDSDGFLLFLRIPRILRLIIVAHPGTRTWCHAFPWWA